MKTGLMYGYRVGIHDTEKTREEYLEEEAALRRKIKRTRKIIQAHKCLSSRGRDCREIYKKVHRHLSNKKIVEEYDKIKEDLQLIMTRKFLSKEEA